MAAVRALVQHHAPACRAGQLAQPRCKAARLAGGAAHVHLASVDHHRRIAHALAQLLQRRDAVPLGQLPGHVGRSILAHVTGDHARERLVAHVDQVDHRHRAHHRTKEVRALGDRGARGQAAVGGAREAQPARRCQARRHRMLGHGIEVIEAALLAQRPGGQPVRFTLLAAAAQLRQQQAAAALQPGHQRRRVARRVRGHVEAAIAVHQRRRRAGRAAQPHLPVADRLPVRGQRMVARGDDALVAQHGLLWGERARDHVVVHGARGAVEAAEVEGEGRRPDGHHPRAAVVLPEAEQWVESRWLRQLDGVVGRAVGGEHADAVRTVQDLEGRQMPIQHRQATQHPVALGHQLGPGAAVGGGGQRDRNHPSAVGTGRGDADEGLATKAADEVARAWLEQGLPVRAAHPPDESGRHRRAGALHRQGVTTGLDDDHHHAAVEAALVHRRAAQAVQHRAQGAAIDHRGLGVADVEAAAVRQPAHP